MKILIGLGNKGDQYQKTYHNLGFMMLEEIVSWAQSSWNFDKKKNCQVSSFLWQEQKIICAKPQTFMNISGVEVQKLLSFYKIPKEDLFIFVDDIALECGKVKVVIGGGNAGHNGIKSIESQIGKGFVKIRLGCGRPMQNQDTADYVLSKISSEKQPIFIEMHKRVLQNLSILLFESVENFNAKVNQK